MFLFLVLAVPAAVALIGFLLLGMGLHGRRIDDHPVCRRCRFDLHGLPLNSEVCSECGTDLSRRRATRLGNRTRRPVLIWIASVLLIAAAAVYTAVGIAGARHVVVEHYEPVWMLRHDLFVGGPNKRAGALAELSSRLTTGRLSQDQINSVVDRVLDLQQDAGKPWDRSWGDWAGAVAAAGKLSEDRLDRFARHSMVLSMTVRPRVRLGDPLPVEFSWTGTTRVGTFPSYFFWQNPIPWTLHVDDVMLERPDNWFMSLGPYFSPAEQPATFYLTDPLRKLKPGTHRATVVLDLDLYDSAGAPHVPRHSQRLTFGCDVVLVAEDTPTVTLTADPQLAGSLQKGLVLTTARTFNSNGRSTCALVVEINPSPADLSYDCIVRHDGQEEHAGHLTVAKGGFGSGLAMFPVNGTTKNVDLLLKPDPGGAAQTVHLSRIAGFAVEFHNVPARFSGGGVPPSTVPTRVATPSTIPVAKAEH